MKNLRLVSLTVIDSKSILAKFTEKLSLDIDVDNILIESQSDSVANPSILSISILDNSLTITTQPLTPFCPYIVIFRSTSDIKFKSLNGDALLFEDNATNQRMILGPSAPENIAQDFLISYLRDNIYTKIDDNTSLINNILQGYSQFLSKSLYDIRQLKNENYLSYNINDEEKIRGAGPFDRLNEEGAYEILRVGRTKTNTSSSLKLMIDDFSQSLISLLVSNTTEELSLSSEDKIGKFNLNSFIATVNNFNVSKLTSLTFIYNNGDLPYVYDINKYGYQILDSKYDQDHGFSYALLNNNQFKLSTAILDDPEFSNQNIDKIQLSYEYRNLGRIIDNDTVVVSTILNSVRETLPPIINIFNLKHAPIVDRSGKIPTSGGITFTNPNTLIGDSHPAFLYEIPFTFGNIPANIGEYSIDYATGTVYVYGATNLRDGTGAFPPLATYNYLYKYKSEIDYVLDEDTNDLVALPNGSLINNSGIIEANYEEVLISDIDYKATLHREIINERINNNLAALNCLKVKNSPITNIFRIFNETSGEIYKLVRWFDNKVYFNFNNPPSIKNITNERASFKDELNEVIFVDSILTNSSNTKIFKCNLLNNQIVAKSEDCFGSSINSSTQFSNFNVFINELWFDAHQSIPQNIDKLSVGQYQIDYINGVIYVAVSSTQDFNLGTISYKIKSIVPIFPHIISVDDLYYRINLSNPKDQIFEYSTFADGTIIPKNLDFSDEAFLNNSITSPYQTYNNTAGAFADTEFVPIVSDNIKSIRGLFEFQDLQGNISPLNFADFATFNDRTITINPIEIQQYGSVQFDGYNYYVSANLNLAYISPNINYSVSVIRVSDSAELYGTGTIITGNPVKIIINGNSPQENDLVNITLTISINNLSRLIIDYNKGDYYIDYTYLADEILISYEHGENHLDFRQSTSVSEGDTYYVSYKVGALRDALLKNFGSLINIPELSTFDVDFERERYRDALSAALESFIQGPTISAMKNICKKISHVEPEIIESAFQNWSLGSSLLNPVEIKTTGDFELISSKYSNGIMINQSNQTISFPASSNLKLENGTFQTWITPEWNGLDNDAILTFSIIKDGYTFPSNQIFIGAAETHPTIINDKFTLSKVDNVIGNPNRNKDGIFIFYNKDESGLFDRWYLNIIDGYSDGNIDGNTASYSIKIESTGLFYDSKSLHYPKPSNVKITTGTSRLTLQISGNKPIDQGITFLSDCEHYIFDYGEDKNQSRLSLFKDPSGYVNFRVFDKKNNLYSISSDISNWRAGDKHHVAASWKLNTKNKRDELHLFIDGFETPNIIKYGSKVSPYLHEKFRTINPEEIAGQINKNIVGSIDLKTTLGSNQVSSSLSFNAYDINPGDTIFINETGFDPNGYTITIVNGNILTLSSSMPLTISDGNFSINKKSFTLTTEIDIYPNIAVSTLSSILNGADLSTTNNSNTVSSSLNFQNLGIRPGYLLRVDGYQFENHYTILSVSGSSLVINDLAPATLSGLTFHIYDGSEVELHGPRALRPDYIIETINNNPTLTITNGPKTNDLIYVKTLGLNHKRIRNKVYQWGNNSNVLMTQLPPPVNLNQVGIYHVILSNTLINSNNSAASAGNFTTNNFTTDQPSISTNGSKLSITINSTDNIDFSSPITVYINSDNSENIQFNESGTLISVNKHKTINYIYLTGQYINVNKSFLTISVKEANSILDSDQSPILRYSYQVRAGNTLSGSGTTITDLSGFFSSKDVGNYIIISSPGPAVGTYQIIGITNDHLHATIDTSLPSFSNGIYQILNVSSARAGFQNGFFLFEKDGYAGQPYNLKQGLYEFDYYTWLSMQMDSVSNNLFIGSDRYGHNQINSLVDETKISGIMLSDTRTGEFIPNNQESITKDYNSLKELKKDVNTLALIHYDDFPLTNDSDYYLSHENKSFVQSGVSVNENFSNSVYLGGKPIILDNDGILNTRKEGTIEFWVSPQFDTTNDPNYRYYFDASATIIENINSINQSSIKVDGQVGKVLSVRLQNGDGNIDYFAGGRVEIDTSGAISEEGLSATVSSVQVAHPILQIMTVKILGDFTQTDYFANGTIGTDRRTIFLGRQLPSANTSLIITYKPADGFDKNINKQIIRLNRPLPHANTPVEVAYVPSGSYGDRISIFKDSAGYVNFNVHANDIDYLVRSPAVWAQNTWHRVKATYKFNSSDLQDSMHLFVDGYEQGNILYGTGLVYGATPHVYGSTFVGIGGLITQIKFRDLINELYIGTDFNQTNPAYALIDNLRISNLSRPSFKFLNENLDVNYNSNIDVVFPVSTDLYTTLLLDFETLLTKNTDFVILQNKDTGRFDFTINVFDSFDLLKNEKVKQALEVLIKQLKTANSVVRINFVE